MKNAREQRRKKPYVTIIIAYSYRLYSTDLQNCTNKK